MSKNLLAALVLCAALAALGGCGSDKDKEKDKGGAKGQGAASAPAPAPGKYGPTAEGLQKMIEDALAAARSDDPNLAVLLSDMPLPEPVQWFPKVFEANAAQRLILEYQGMKGKDFIAQGTELFKTCLKQGRTQVTVTLVRDASDQNATGLQAEAFKAMKDLVPLYTVRFSEPGKATGSTLWSFVVVDGHWRLLGKMKAVRP